MGTPSIAHYGTTLIERPGPDDVPQAEHPMTGDLEKTDRFLKLLGLEILITNMYPGIGRQYIYARGRHGDADYVEKDTFTSYVAVERPASDKPRVGDTIFRITHADSIALYKQFCAEGLVTCLSTKSQELTFQSGDANCILIMGPDKQRYELCATKDTVADNHVVYVWTDPSELEEAKADFTKEFAMQLEGIEDFHGLGTAHLLRREDPGIIIGLLVPETADGILPRWTDDIFKEAGYSHFRLGSPNKAHTLTKTREAFPPGGDVDFVYYRDSYLELVQNS